MEDIPDKLQELKDKISRDFCEFTDFHKSENLPAQEELDALLFKIKYQIDQINSNTSDHKADCSNQPKESEFQKLAGGEWSEDSSKSKTFVFEDEGHTLGNALRGIISSYPDVQFCGYTLPHPAEAKMHFRIQMIKGKAVDALKRGLEDLVQVCDVTLEKFDEELNSS